MAELLCPVWIGYLLANPLRNRIHHPEKILAPYVTSGMTAADIGCAMGFFSIPLARMVGVRGKVICIDIQEKMLRVLEEKARKENVSDRILTRLCDEHSLHFHDTEKIDFALAFAVVHEAPKGKSLLRQIHRSMASKGKLLIAEPKLHVSRQKFRDTVESAEQVGFQVTDEPVIPLTKSVLLEKK